MHSTLGCVPVLLCALIVAEPPGESRITLLSGASEEVRVVRLGSKAIGIVREGQPGEIPTADLLGVAFARPVVPVPSGPYLEVRLLDDTLLRCNAVGFQGNVLELRLFSGIKVECPLSAVRWVLCEAHDENNRAEFKQLLARNSPLDILRLVSRDGTTINTFEGILGEADAAGQTIQFKTDDTVSRINLARVRGMIFQRRTDPDALKPVCRVSDGFHNVIAVRELEQVENDLLLVTPAGVKLRLPLELVHQVDFSPGKLAYLSDLEPVSSEFRFGVKADLVRGLPEPYGRDATLFASQNGTSRQIRIGGRAFAKGLNVHSPSVLEFEVSGYNWFRCVLGLDDGVSRPGRAGVRIEGDGRELFSTLVVGGEKPRELEVPIRGVRRLRLVVDRGDDDDELGDHVSFGDARVTK